MDIRPDTFLKASEALPHDVANQWLAAFSKAIAADDTQIASSLFEADGFWRDMVALTWDIQTVEGREPIRELLNHACAHSKPRDFRVVEADLAEDGVVEAWLGFETPTGSCTGHVRLRDGLAWTFLSVLDELKDHEASVGARRPNGAEHGARPGGRKSWLEQRQAETAALGVTLQPEVVIIGGGQAGLSLAARLKQLSVPTLVIDRQEKPGDTWRSRYRTLCLHDPVWYDSLPYLDFPQNWPVFTPKDKMGDFLQYYAGMMEIDFWGCTDAVKASYDETAGHWELVVHREGKPVTLTPRQLVFATGLSGFPNIPDFPGAETFQGVQQHSAHHPGPDGWKGKKAVVVGSNSSAHDICAALWEEGADVTMVQRSSTMVARSATLFDIFTKSLYSEEALESGITVDKADLKQAALPFRVLLDSSKPLVQTLRERDADFYDRLAKTGFKLDFGPDDAGLWIKYITAASGYYIDVGASDLIIEGKIKLQQGSVREIRPTSVLLENGAELAADLIVYATGYGSMTQIAAKILPQNVIENVGPIWGIGLGIANDPGPWEGELRNMWKPTRQEGLWFHGGNLYQCRFFSKLLALQIKARMANIPTPVFVRQESQI